MATYDVHQHLWPARFRAALAARETPPLLSGDELVTMEGRFRIDLTEHEPETRIRALDRDGIDVAVLSLQASLGLVLDAEASEIRFERPALPDFVGEIVLRNLRLREASADVRLRGYGGEVVVSVQRRRGQVGVVASH